MSLSVAMIYQSHLETLVKRRDELVGRIACINDEIVRIKALAKQDGVQI